MNIPLIGQARDTVALSDVQAQVLIEIEPLLREARLHLVCPKCLAAGHGVQALVGGSNGFEDRTWTVDCQCTSRRYQRGPG